MTFRDELMRYREEREIEEKEHKIRVAESDKHEEQEKRKMLMVVEKLKKEGIEASGETNGYWADLRTSDWIIYSVDQESRGFVTSYINPYGLLLSAEDIETIKEILSHHELERDSCGHKPSKFSGLRSLLEFKSYKTHGGSAVLLCEKELVERRKEKKRQA